MKIGIQTCGSAGDMYPMFALAEALCHVGHDVTLYYTSFFGQSFSFKKVERLTCLSSAIFDEEFNYSVPSRPIFDMSPEEQMQYLKEDVFKPFSMQISKAAETLCQEQDMVIGVAMLYQLICMAEKYNIPFISYQVDNVYVPAPNDEKIWLDGWIEENFADTVNAYREKYNLPPVENLRRTFYRSKILNLLAFSPVLEPKQQHWGDTFEVCGYFYREPIVNLDNTLLQAFLNAGSPPIFISVGSMAFYESDIETLRNMLISAVNLAGCRAIVQIGNYTEIETVSNNIYMASYVPHEAVLPYCMGMIHHGGSGTVHTSLKYGCPSITMAYAFDQFFWGKKIVENGASSTVLYRNRVDEIQLAGDIRKLMCYPEYRANAQALRLRMKRENGVKKAVRCIEHIINNT